MKIFKDRIAAGELLANRLTNIKADIVLGIPRGGVMVAAIVAKELNLPLDIIVTRKIGAPGQEELALGAIDPDGEVVWDSDLLEQLNPPAGGLKFKIEEAKEEIKRREKLYRGDRGIQGIQGKTVILVDDGIATGSTILSAIKYLKRHGASIILAIPVASQDALRKIENEVDKSVVLETPEYFQAVGQFYHQFEAVTDEEVIQLLNGR
ncbi:MAG: phosphoribosyltransferase family protein [Candidatus Daviesbacteria bacterium]|nr:phosphoribosyltransferase family protein [Candidatus Daviesbacteria bacterium]